MDKIENIAVIIPAYNPDNKMISFIEELKDSFSDIIVVNDGCGEEYSAIFNAVKEYSTVLVHPENKGKGAALKTAFEYVCQNTKKLQAVVTADADGQHTLSDVRACCRKFLDNPKQAVFGCRDFYSDVNIPERSKFGNRLTSRLLKFFCDISLSDTQTGLRVLPVSCLDELIKVKGDRYEYEMNMIFALSDLDVGWTEQSISVIYLDDNKSSHFNPIKDSIKIYRVFLKFCISSFGSSLIDLIIFTILCSVLRNVSPVLKIIDGVVMATVIARICSGIFNFSINRLIFRKKKTASLSKSGPKYLVVWLIQMLLSAFIVSGISLLLHGGYELLIKIVVDTILFFISFRVQQKWVFR